MEKISLLGRENLTFIIAIQAEDSIVVSSDTRKFTLNNHHQLQPNYADTIKKMEIWQSGVFASNGIDLIGNQVFNQLCKEGDINRVQSWLVATANDVAHRFSETHSVLSEQIACTQIYCSYPTPQRPQLRSISQSDVKAFEINSLGLMTYQKDLSAILPLLQSLQQNIKARYKFVDNKDWMGYYVECFQNIFYEMNKANDWVSQDFHVYFEDCTDRFFGHIPNQKNA